MKVNGAGGLPIKPERLSAQTKLATTGVLFQPAALGGGVREPVIVGGVVSTIQVNDAGDESALPELSTARTENV